MHQLRSVLVLALGLAACGSNNKNNNTPDAPKSADAPAQPPADAPAATCGTTVTPGMADISFDNAQASTPAIGWIADAGMLDGNTLRIQYEFYGGIETSLMGTFDLTQGKQNNYASCAVCVHGFEVDSMGNVVKQFFQSAGSVTLASDPITSEHVMASFANLQLQEVMIDPMTYMSTPVAGGSCAGVGALSLDHDKVPNAWTCTHDKYAAGATCDCMCGVSDPDCDVAGTTVAGCTANQTCYNAGCVAVVANDTCAQAAAITIGTPVNGTTIGASADYDVGLETMACTGVAQHGRDVAYKVDLAANQAITVTLSGVAMDFDPSISLVGPGDASVCSANITTCVAGADANTEGMGETFTYTATTAGTYYVIVDSFYATEAGAFTLTVTSP